MVRCLDGSVLTPGKHYLVTIPEQFLGQDLFNKYHNQLIKCDDVDIHDKSIVLREVRLPATWLRNVQTDLYTNQVLGQFANRFMAEVDAWENSNPVVVPAGLSSKWPGLAFTIKSLQDNILMVITLALVFLALVFAFKAPQKDTYDKNSPVVKTTHF